MKKILLLVALAGAAILLISTLCPWFDATAKVGTEIDSQGSLLGVETIYGTIVFVLALVSAICILKKQYGVAALLGLSALFVTFFYMFGQESSGDIIKFTNGKAGAEKQEVYTTCQEWKDAYKGMTGAFTDIGGFGAVLAIIASIITAVCSTLLYRKAKKENA